MINKNLENKIVEGMILVYGILAGLGIGSFVSLQTLFMFWIIGVPVQKSYWFVCLIGIGFYIWSALSTVKLGYAVHAVSTAFSVKKGKSQKSLNIYGDKK